MDRSANMRAIRSKDMKPELAVRSLVHRLGYRSRLHRKDLPGKPDLAFGPRRKVIFVHGCFSQGHNFKKAHILKSKRGYWGPKLRRKKARDRQHMRHSKQTVGSRWLSGNTKPRNVRRSPLELRRFCNRTNADDAKR